MGLYSTVRKGSDTLHTLLLRFSAPLQSWGSASVYDLRETDYMPTKSGVIGMLAAALGRRRNESLEDLVELKFGVRIDLPGTKLDDFHITQMGEKLNANLSHRVYLSDAIFLVGLESGDFNFLQIIADALANPKFCIFLGRKSCPPTLPLVLGLQGKDLESALRGEEWLVPDWRKKSLFRFKKEIPLRIVIESLEGSAAKKDVPVSFSPMRREYRYRRMKEAPAKIVTDEFLPVLTEHDPMVELK